ncbi:MAG: LysR family transcriptional regulator [Rhodobacterales bacterium]|uniref:LysR family transcriptional regulator n=1 Tax=Puniceibacterium antarcticum TaxID=1206336 RepID=UPI0015D47336|nr:LysR family transcriptional regulator [Puniceibacterium antarcticum]
MTDLNHLRIFERVASHGSFSNAARQLGLPKSSVSRAVSKLEEAFGTRLLQRTTREVTLTAAGAALHSRIAPVMKDLDTALTYVETLTGAPAGTLRVSAPIGLGINALGDRLPDFLARYPQIDLILTLEGARADLVSDSIDVALRFGDLPDSSLVAQRLGSVARMICASPTYLSAHGTPSHPNDLPAHRIVDMPTADGRPRQWRMNGPDGPITEIITPSVSVDEMLTIHRLVRGGAGIGIVPAYLCEAEIINGDLCRVLPDWSLEAVPLSIVFPSQRELAPSVRAFIDFMREIEGMLPWSTARV